MKKISFIFLLVFILQIGESQITAESVVGKHSGLHNWSKLPVSLQLQSNLQYEISTYDFELQTQSTVKGTWRIEKNKIILTDIAGNESQLQKDEDVYSLIASNGLTCNARFYQNRKLEEFWALLKKQGC